MEIIYAQKGTIVKSLVKSATKETPVTGIFANTSSTEAAVKSLKDINKASGIKRSRITVQQPKQYVKVTSLGMQQNKAAEEAQRAIEDKAYEIKQNQIDLARKL